MRVKPVRVGEGESKVGCCTGDTDRQSTSGCYKLKQRVSVLCLECVLQL